MIKSQLVAAAISGMMLGAAATAHAAGDPAPKAGDQKATDKNSCKGKNACKGKGGCKTDKHACKGQNECKGQGGCATDGSKPSK